MKLKGLRLVIICSYCGLIDKYPKYTNFIFIEKYQNQKINDWFCSERCKHKQIMGWDTRDYNLIQKIVYKLNRMVMKRIDETIM